MVLDVHTHREAPYPEGIISLDVLSPLFSGGEDGTEPLSVLADGQLYSAGIHPWNTERPLTERDWEILEALASDPRVCAIGECGVDLGHGAPLYQQLLVLKRQIELAEKMRKPMVFHCVKSADILMGLKRDFNPRQPWIVHGFRGKPALAAQLTEKGFYLSFGEKFNPDTVSVTNPERILAETDESLLPIEEIIARLSEAAGYELLPRIEENIRVAAIPALQPGRAH